MKKLFKLSLFILPVMLLGVSCKKDSSKISQDSIYQKYTMNYDEFANKTTLTAYFYKDENGGKNLELSGSSNVTMNGTTLSYSGGSYSTVVNGVVSSAVFVFTDTDGKTFSNTLYPANYVSNYATSYLNNGVSSYWNFGGDDVASGEEVKVTFVSQVDNSKSVTFSSTTVGSSSITMAGSSLSVLPNGNATAKICRIKTGTTGNFTSVGGTTVSTYTGLENVVEVY